MRDFKRPAFMQRAAFHNRGHMAILEILIALLVFLVSSFAMGIFYLPLMVLYLMSNKEYMSLLLSGDTVSMNKAINMAMQLPEWLIIIVLISEILMIVIVILYCRFLEKRKPDTMGFCRKGMGKQYLFGALGGVLFFTVAYLLCLLTGSTHFDGLAENIVPGYIIGYLVGYMIQGLAEEVLCRGYLFVSLTRRYSVKYSVVISAAFFALLHGMNSNLTFLAIINLFLFGVFAALLLIKYENIWIVGAFHSLWNFAQGNLYGIQVSGNSLQNSIFASTSRENMSIINGGAFGMEGGLGVTIVMVAGLAFLLWSLKQEGKIIESPTQASFVVSGEESSFPHKPSEEVPPIDHVPPMRNGLPSEHVPPVNVPQREAGTARRENMGTAPGETPWRPEHASQYHEQEVSKEQTSFDANYFKD